MVCYSYIYILVNGLTNQNTICHTPSYTICTTIFIVLLSLLSIIFLFRFLGELPFYLIVFWLGALQGPLPSPYLLLPCGSCTHLPYRPISSQPSVRDQGPHRDAAKVSAYISKAVGKLKTEYVSNNVFTSVHQHVPGSEVCPPTDLRKDRPGSRQLVQIAPKTWLQQQSRASWHQDQT